MNVIRAVNISAVYKSFSAPLDVIMPIRRKSAIFHYRHLFPIVENAPAFKPADNIIFQFPPDFVGII